jgi:predicted permease
MLADIRYALRGFRRSPGFAVVAVLSLALGIGANTAIFSLVNAILLRSLPVHEPNRLVIFALSRPDRYGGSAIPQKLFQQIRDNNTALRGFAAVDNVSMTLSGEVAERVEGQAVSGNFFETLGLKAVVGRVLTSEDERNGHPVCVFSYGFWWRRFAGDPNVIGSRIQINGQPFTVLGVTPKEFAGLDPGSPVDITVPLMRRDLWLRTFGRLSPGVSVAQAQGSLDAMWHHLGGNQALQRFGSDDIRVVLEPGARGFAGLRQQYERPLLLLMVVVGLVLLIACANITNLLMARASGRAKEIAVRLALGAGRTRLIRQLLAESMLLTLCGAAPGIVLAYWADQVLLALAPRRYGGGALMIDISPDWRVLLFTLCAAILVTVLCGIAPAIRSTRPDMGPVLKGEACTRALERFSFTNALVVVQVGLSLVLLIGAGLFLRSLHNLKSVDPGFDPEHMIVLAISPSIEGYSPAASQEFFATLVERARKLPGVVAASPGLISPLSGDFSITGIVVPGYQPSQNEPPTIAANWVGPDYFKTIRTPLVAGRMFTDQDGGARKVAIVNQKAAAHFWPHENPIGKHVGIGGRNRDDCEIVGVVRDVKSESLRREAQATVYMPFRQNRRPHISLHVRVAGQTTPVISALIREINALDPKIVPDQVATIAAQIDQTIALDRLMATLTALFGLLAVVLSAVGLYGVMSFAVAARTREIGIRMALGAGQARVLGQVLGESAVLTAIGLVLGVTGALWASCAVGSFLYGLSATDPWTYAALAMVLAGIALSAAWIPARRATLVDPMIALRYE